jgi:hypothetical protein
MLTLATSARGFEEEIDRFAKVHTDETILLGSAYEV